MATEPKSDSTADETFTEAMLGKSFFQSGPLRGLAKLSADWRVILGAGVLGFLVFVPYLGAVGLWDPWETHYGEVARSMIQRRDYVHPYWENAWFFSKPAFTMWMQALGMQLVGAMSAEGSLGRLTEWGFRLPFATFSILAVVLMALAVSRTVSRRAGLALAFVLCTMPLYFLITRQAVTDTPMISALLCAMACAIIGQLDPKTQHRTAWWYAFYVFCGIGTLAKGLLGVGIPAIILVLYAGISVVPWDAKSLSEHVTWLLDSKFRRQVNEGSRPMPVFWAQLYRMRLLTGIGVFAAVALPWYLRMILFESVDDEGKLFWYRFFVHDHLNRLGAGVHTTTPGGNFTYFIEQGGYAIFPWVVMIPGAIAIAARLKARSKDPADHLGIIAVIWAAFTFFLIGSSATKFHHYVLPMLPPLAVLIAMFLDKLWTEGIAKHAPLLLLGVPLFALVGKDLATNPKNFTDLFVYNYDRPYPVELVTRPLGSMFARPLWIGDLIALSLLGLGGYLMFDSFANKERAPSPLYRGLSLLLGAVGAGVLIVTVTRASVSPTLFLGLALILVAAYGGFEASRADAEKHLLGALSIGLGLVGIAALWIGLTRPLTGDPLIPLLTEIVNVKRALGFALVAGGGVCGVAVALRSRVMFFGAGWALVAAFALWFNWSHWVDLSHHWTQRDLFWRYYSQRQASEPITAFLMNWRGETFYSRNTVKQIKDNGLLAQYANQPGREWALVEHNRLGILKSAVGADKTVTLIDKDINNKFVLVTID